MTTEYQPTPEEKAYGRLIEENKEMLSEAACTVLKEAEAAAYADNLVHNVSFQLEDYDEAMEKMRLAETEITGRDRGLLAKAWRSALAAAASIDPEDTTPAGHRVDRGDVHYYYRVFSRMVEEVLQEKGFAERESEELEDPF